MNKRLCTALHGLAQRGLLSLLAVDEAHCVCDWGARCDSTTARLRRICGLFRCSRVVIVVVVGPGFTFRKSYLRLPTFFDSLSPRPPVMALSASASSDGRAKILHALRLRDPVTVLVSLNRPNIRYEVRYPDSWAEGMSQDADMLALLREVDAMGEKLTCGIIYCRSKKECDRVAALLCQSSLPAAAFHAGVKDNQRAAVQADWIAGRVHFVVATVAFGMGAPLLTLAAAQIHEALQLTHHAWRGLQALTKPMCASFCIGIVPRA